LENEKAIFAQEGFGTFKETREEIMFGNTLGIASSLECLSEIV
jgi:hypothetical protein